MERMPFITAILIVVVAMAAGIFIFQDRSLLDRDREYEKQESVGLSHDDCTISADCVLVQDGWCKTVLAVNKTKEVEWREKDVKQTEIARQNRQTCELVSEEYLDIKNFSAVCKESKCVVEFSGSSTQ